MGWYQRLLGSSVLNVMRGVECDGDEEKRKEERKEEKRGI
jgi:hypothetical protein